MIAEMFVWVLGKEFTAPLEDMWEVVQVGVFLLRIVGVGAW